MAYGIPNPYVSTTHPFPSPATGGKGGIWTRPVFGFPFQRAVQNGFKPSDFNDGNPALRGLGELLFNAENGVFGTAKGGGGVFGPSLYGLGDDAAPCTMPEVCGQVLNSPAAQAQMDMSLLDVNGNFTLYCADPAYQSHISDACTAAIAAATPAPPVDAGQAGSSLDKTAVMAVQQTLNGALTKAGYRALTVDGVPGPAMCGAITWYRAQTGNATAGQQYDSICSTKASTPPSKASAASSYSAPVYKAPAASAASKPAAATSTKSSMMPSAGTLAMIGGGVLAIGLAVVGKKKGWF